MTQYKHLKPLAWEIIWNKAQQAQPEPPQTKPPTQPHYREHTHTKHLQLILPTKTLTRLEQLTLQEAGYKKTNYHNHKGYNSTIIIIDIPKLKKENPELAKKLTNHYNKLWEQKIGPNFPHKTPD